MSHPIDYSQPAASQVDALSTLGPTQETDAAQPMVLQVRGALGQRLDRFLADQLADVSRTRLQKWIALGAVKVDGLQVLARHKLRGLESIEVVPRPSEAERAFEPDPVDLKVVHEDADLMVIDKPVGLVVHPAPGHWRGTLMNGLLHARPDSARLPRAGIVHRLDKDTSGLMMVARSERAFERLTVAVAARSVHRRYVALVHGETPIRFSIDAPIGRDPRDRLRMAVVDLQRGKAACTHVVRLASAGGVSLLCCDLETGRTHQIRVHLSSRGFPLVGDTLYGGHPLRGCARQALHAWRLALDHPVSGQRMAFESPLPVDLAALLAQSGLPDPVAPDEGKR